MRPRRWRDATRSGAGAAALLAAGCAQRHAIEEYFPLRVGSAWVYESTSLAGPERLEYRILGRTVGAGGETRYLLDAGGERYYLRQGERVAISVSPGIWSVLLEGPLTVGRRFDGGLAEPMVHPVRDGEGRPQSTFTTRRNEAPATMAPIPSSGYKVVTSFDRTVEVPAGRFTRCLEVAHLAGTLVGLKLYAPGVGLVYAEAWQEREGKRARVARQALVSYVEGAGEETR